MPYPHEHAARMNDPGDYESIRREPDKFGPGIDVLWGVTKTGKGEIQALRFKADKFTADEARKWLDEHDMKPKEFEPASSIEASMLRLAGSEAPWCVLSRDDKSDVPTRRYVKEIARVGQYVKVASGGRVVQSFQITPDMLSHWVSQFNSMKHNGVKVPIPMGHNAVGMSDLNCGFVDSLWASDSSLWMTCTLSGTTAIEAASRDDVSIFVPKTFTDGRGFLYENAITHVAMCPDPLLPGMGDFIPIAASRSIVASRDDNTTDTPGATKVNERLVSIATKLGLDPKALVDDNVACSLIEQAIDGLVGKTNTEESKPEEIAAQTPDPLLVSTVADNRRLKLERLITSGCITPAMRDDIEKTYVGKDNTVIAAAMTWTNKMADGFEYLVSILEQNKGKYIAASQTPPQSLTDPHKSGNSKSELVLDAERRAEEAEKKNRR